MIQVKDLNIYNKTISFKTSNKGLVFINGKNNDLFYILSGITRVNSSVLVNGYDLSKVNDSLLSKYRNSVVSIQSKDLNLLKDFNVYENISFFISLKGKKLEKQEIDNYLKMLQIDNLGFSYIDELTIGQKQKVAVLIAYLKDTPIILLDHIIEDLDEHDTNDILSFLSAISENRLIILFSTYIKGANKYNASVIELDNTNIELVSEEKSKLLKPKFNFFKAMRLVLKDFKNNQKTMKLFIVLLIMNMLIGIITSNFITFNYKIVHKDVVERENITEFFVSKEYEIGNKVYNVSSNDKYLNYDFINKDKLEAYYTLSFDKIHFVEIDQIDEFSHVVKGVLPSKLDEIVVSEYQADLIMKYADNLDGSPKNKDELVALQTPIKIGDNVFKVVGYTEDKLNEYFYLKTILKDSLEEKDKKKLNTLDKTYLTKNHIYLLKGSVEKLSLIPNKAIYKDFNINGKMISNFNYLNEKIHLKEPSDAFISSLEEGTVTLNEETYKLVFEGDLKDNVGKLITVKVDNKDYDLKFKGITPRGNYINYKDFAKSSLDNISYQYNYIKEIDKKKRNDLVDNYKPTDVMSPYIRKFSSEIRDRYLGFSVYLFGITIIFTLFMIIVKDGIFKNSCDLQEYIFILKNHGIRRINILLAYTLELLISLMIAFIISLAFAYTLINIVFKFYTTKYYLMPFTMFSFNYSNFILPALMILIYITVIIVLLVINIYFKGKKYGNKIIN